MKNTLLSIIILLFIFFFTGCEFDNYDPPKSFLNGVVTYNNNPVNVRSNGTQLELWQYGYPLRQKISVYIDQDGKFSARLFDGNYKIVRLAGGPWENQNDSIDVKVSGTTTIDVPVTPYFTISNESFSYNSGTGVITATCNVTKVGSRAIDNLTFYVGTTTIVDANNSVQSNAISSGGLTDLTAPKTMTITLNATNKSRKYIFVRIGVKTAGIGERLYTPVQNILLN